MRLSVLAFLPFALIACTPDNAEDTGEKTEDTGDTGMVETSSVRLLHLSPDAPNVDVYAAGNLAVPSLPFTGGTSYLEVPAGNLDVALTAEGADLADAVFSATLPLAAGTSYSAVAFGYLADLDAMLLTDDRSGIAADEVRLQVVHAAPDVGDVDIWELQTGAQLADDFPYTGSAVLDVPVGPLVLGLDLDDDANPDVTFEVPELPGGALYDVFAVNDASGPFLLAHLPDGTTVRINPKVDMAMLRVIHLSPDAPAVDVFVNDSADPIVSDLAFTEGTAYLDVPAGTYSVQVAPAGMAASDAVLRVDGLTLDAGTAYTAVAYGGLAGIGALALVDDPTDIQAGYVRLQVTHAADGVGNVDVWELSGPTRLIDNFAYAASGSLDVPAGALSLGLDVDEDAVPDVTFSVPSLGMDTWVNVYAVADATGPFLLAQLADGTVAIVRPD